MGRVRPHLPARRALLLVVAIVLASTVWGAPSASAAPTLSRRNAAPPPAAHREDQVTGGAHVQAIAQQHKNPALASSLVAVEQQEHQAGRTAAVHQARSAGLSVHDDRVRVTIQADATDIARVQTLIARTGGIVEHAAGDSVQALVSPGDLDQIAADAAVRYVQPSRRLIPNALAGEEVATSQADAWFTSGAVASGVKIAVLDGDFSGYQQRQASGDLPTSLVTLNFCAEGLTNGLDGGHGTAVAEVVHEMAPAAQLYLVCAGTLNEIKQALPQIYAQGIKIINHSRGIFNTSRGDGARPPNPQSVLPEALISDAYDHGVLWINSAGNSASTHWSGTFSDSDADNAHDFTPGDEGNSFILVANGSVSIFLKWDSWPASAQDYDLYLVRASDGVIVAFSVNEQSGSQMPTEDLFFTNTGPTEEYFVAIIRYSASQSPRFDLFVEGNVGPIQHVVAAGSLSDFAVSPRAMVVGAACWHSSELQSYSSRGPTIDGRIKPDITGYDSVSSATFGSFSGCGVSGFAGTSASTPNVAGAAALAKDVNTVFTHEEVKTYLEGKVVDRDAPGKDNNWGAGMLKLGGLALPGTVACSPRPNVALQLAVESGLLAVSATATGQNNRLFRLVFGHDGDLPRNALLNFQDGRANVSGATTYYTPFGSVQTSFTAKREPAGHPMTVPMIVVDRCGSFETFVGAGTAVPGL